MGWGQRGRTKNAEILLFSNRMSSGRGCGVGRKACGGRKENLRSHCFTHVASGLCQRITSDAPARPRPHARTAWPLPASTPSPLPVSHLSGMLQDSIDQCLQNAPTKNDTVTRCLSHGPRHPLLLWPGLPPLPRRNHTQQHFFPGPHLLRGQAGFPDLPFYKHRQEDEKRTFSECLICAQTEADTLTCSIVSNTTSLVWILTPTSQLRQQKLRG